MSHIRSLEAFAGDYERLLDGWEAGGVDGLVIGPMRLNVRVAIAHSGWREWMPHTGEESAAFDPHPDGDSLTALHLDAIITALNSAGIQRFTYLNSTNLTHADWAMLSHHRS